MQFLIADTFTDSLARLNEDERKAAKITALDVQLDPTSNGLNFHRIDKSKDKNFWSIRVSRDVRIIVHKTNDSLMLCYVGHHDNAYSWAERRKLETHPKTGAAQLVEVRETVREIAVPRYVDAPAAKPVQVPLFADADDGFLLDCGVPLEWLTEVRRATDDTILDLADHLPGEAAEALLELATGGRPVAARSPHSEDASFLRKVPSSWMPDSVGEPEAETVTVAALQHPDALRRFRVMHDVEELEQALDAPWDKWTVFLHPAQQDLVERNFNGPARVSGSAGTGKTIVALHRAVFLARANPEARVLLTTFSEALANLLRTKLRRLISSEPRLGERIDVMSMDAVGRRLYELHFGALKIASDEELAAIIRDASKGIEGVRFSQNFLSSEWSQVVDAWQLEGWEAYRDIARLGRKTRLPETQRSMLWNVFSQVRNELTAAGLVTYPTVFNALASKLTDAPNPPFDFIVVDEAQDIGVAQLRFLSALGGSRSNSLFFAGDLGQRIFQQPFSWKALGVDIRGCSRTLRVNYRTSHQIRSQADRLLGPEISDVDGNAEDRRGTVSVFNGADPTIVVCESSDEERDYVAAWLRERAGEGVLPAEIAVFVRSAPEVSRAVDAVRAAGLEPVLLNDNLATAVGKIAVSTMHLAKGMEFRAVIVMACDDEVIPSQTRIEAVGDEAELEDVYNTERQLLYVACTRARDFLLVTSGGDASEFLDDLVR